MAAETVEGRGPIKGNTGKQNASRTQSRIDAPSALERVRRAAKADKKRRFTALLHHVDVDRLRESMASRGNTMGSNWRTTFGRFMPKCTAERTGRNPRGECTSPNRMAGSG